MKAGHTLAKILGEVPYLAYHVRSNIKRHAWNAVDQQEYEPACNAAPYGHVTQLQRKKTLPYEIRVRNDNKHKRE